MKQTFDLLTLEQQEQELDFMRGLVRREEQELEQLHTQEQEINEKLLQSQNLTLGQDVMPKNKKPLMLVLDLYAFYKEEAKDQTLEPPVDLSALPGQALILDIPAFREQEQILAPILDPSVIKELQKELAEVQKKVKFHRRALSRWQRQEQELLSRQNLVKKFEQEDGEELTLDWNLDLNLMQDVVRLAKSEQKQKLLQGYAFSEKLAQQPSLLSVASRFVAILIALLPNNVPPKDQEGMMSVIYETCQAEYETKNVWRFYQTVAHEIVGLVWFVIYSWVLVISSYPSRLQKWFSLL